MLQLLTFGGLRVTRGDGTVTELTSQRRRLAVLAVVAASAPGGVSRDRLLGLLWPDAETERGRHALAQLVYNLRRDLGVSPIDGTAELQLVPDVMQSDLVEFRAAMARGDHAAAAALYTGPFLDGFFVPDAGEFERWTEEERQRLARQAVSAIETLVKTAEAAGDAAALVQWTGRLTELEPLSARRALAHMRALVQRGDRETALAHGQRYSALAAADLSGEVDIAVGLEMERLRALTSAQAEQPVAASPPPRVEAASVKAEPSIVPAAAPDLAPAVADDHTIVPAALNRSGPLSSHARKPTLAWRWAVAAVAAVGAAIVAAMAARPPVLPVRPGDRLLVADVLLSPSDSTNARAFRIALEGALRQSARVNLLSPALLRESLRRMGRNADSSGVNEQIAVEVAAREGVRYVLALSVTQTGQETQLTLRALTPGTGELIEAYRSLRPSAALLTGIDDVVAQLRHDLGESRSDIRAAIPLPRATTASLEALRLYASGRDAYNRALYNDARGLYLRALELDSGFAAAHASLGAVEAFTNHPALAETHFARARALADRLPPRERLLIEADAARGQGDWIKAAELHSSYLQRFPEDYEVYAALGYDQMRANDPAAALTAFDTVRAHGLMTANSWVNTASVYRLQDNDSAARRAYAEAFRSDTTMLRRVIINEQYGSTLLRLGFPDSARAVFRLLLASSALDQVRAHRSLAYVDLFEGRYGSAVQHLQTGVALSSAQPTAALTQARDRILLANTWRELGQTVAALREVRLAAQLCIDHPLESPMLLWAGKAAVRLGDLALARVLNDSLKARARAGNSLEQSAVDALDAELQVAAGHFDQGITAARRAMAAGDNAVALETLAHALDAAGQRDEAWRTYEQLRDKQHLSLGREGQQDARLAPLTLALFAEEAGRSADARTRLADFLQQWPDADAKLTILTELRRRLGQASR